MNIKECHYCKYKKKKIKYKYQKLKFKDVNKKLGKR